MSRAQIINNPLVKYNHKIPLMKKLTHWNIIQCGTQKTSLDVMIGSCFLDSQYGVSVQNLGCSNYRCINNDVRNHSTQLKQWTKLTRKESKRILLLSLEKAYTERIWKKRMIGIWAECTWFIITNQSLLVQARMKLKQVWFSDPNITEIY